MSDLITNQKSSLLSSLTKRDHSSLQENEMRARNQPLQKTKDFLKSQKLKTQTIVINSSTKMPGVSMQSQIEELRFLSEEHSSKLEELYANIADYTPELPDFYPLNAAISVPLAVWLQLKDITGKASFDFQAFQRDMNTLFDQTQDELQKAKSRCSELRSKYKRLQREKEDLSSIYFQKGSQRSKNVHSADGRTTNKHSRKSSGSARLKKDLNVTSIEDLMQQSCLEISNVYNKNRTQMNTFMDEMETAVHEMKYAQEKLKLKHLGTMTSVEAEMEKLCENALRSARSHKSVMSNLQSQLSSAQKMKAGLKSGKSPEPDDFRTLEKQRPKNYRSNSSAQKSNSKKRPSQHHRSQNQNQSKTTGNDPDSFLDIQTKDFASVNNALTPMISNVNSHNNSKTNLQIESESKLEAQGSSKRRGKSLAYELPQSPASRGASKPSFGLVPPLPIHMINKDQKDIPAQRKLSSRRNAANANSGNKNGRNSARSTKPPAPESYRSNQQLSHRSNQRSGVQQANPGGPRSGADSMRSLNSKQNISGALLDGYLVNPVMLQGAGQFIATSKFDKNLESDAESNYRSTQLFDTKKLYQFSEDYKTLLEQAESTENRILIKGILFNVHEKEIKKQLHFEAEKRRADRQKQKLQNADPYKNMDGGKSDDERLPISSRSSMPPSMNESKNGANNSKDIKLSQILDVTEIFPMESSLSELGTLERQRNHMSEKDHLQEAKLEQILAVSQECQDHLKTVTQRELQLYAEDNWQQVQKIKLEGRRVLEWSNDEVEANDIAVDLNDINFERDLNQAHSFLCSTIKSDKNNHDCDESIQNLFDKKKVEDSFNNDSVYDERVLLQEEKPSFALGNHRQKVYAPPVISQSAVVSEESNNEDSFTQKKSLEVITERQSEFSNTTGTNARPGSHRSKHSRQPQSSQKNVNQSQASIAGPNGPNNSASNSVIHAQSKMLAQPPFPLVLEHPQLLKGDFPKFVHKTPTQQKGVEKQTPLQKVLQNAKSSPGRDEQISYIDNSFQDESYQKFRGRELQAPQVTTNFVNASDVSELDILSVSPLRLAQELNLKGLKPIKTNEDPTDDIAESAEDNSQPSPRKLIFRSNSEVYLKSTDMQDESDFFQIPMPIQYVAEVTNYDPTISHAQILVDASQLNNLTRHMESNGSHHFNQYYRHSGFGKFTHKSKESNQSFYINSTMYNQLQRLFLKAQMTQNSRENDQQSRTGGAHSRLAGNLTSEQLGRGATVGAGQKGHALRKISSVSGGVLVDGNPSLDNLILSKGTNGLRNTVAQVIQGGLTGTGSGMFVQHEHDYTHSSFLLNNLLPQSSLDLCKKTLQRLQSLQKSSDIGMSNPAAGLLLFANSASDELPSKVRDDEPVVAGKTVGDPYKNLKSEKPFYQKNNFAQFRKDSSEPVDRSNSSLGFISAGNSISSQLLNNSGTRSTSMLAKKLKLKTKQTLVNQTTNSSYLSIANNSAAPNQRSTSSSSNYHTGGPQMQIMLAGQSSDPNSICIEQIHANPSFIKKSVIKKLPAKRVINLTSQSQHLQNFQLKQKGGSVHSNVDSLNYPAVLNLSKKVPTQLGLSKSSQLRKSSGTSEYNNTILGNQSMKAGHQNVEVSSYTSQDHGLVTTDCNLSYSNTNQSIQTNSRVAAMLLTDNSGHGRSLLQQH